MHTRVENNPATHRFEIFADDALAGFTVYDKTSTARSFTHTEIDPAFEGKGLGSVLVRHALDQTRADGLAALLFCPFVRGYIERHPE